MQIASLSGAGTALEPTANNAVAEATSTDSGFAALLAMLLAPAAGSDDASDVAGVDAIVAAPETDAAAEREAPVETPDDTGDSVDAALVLALAAALPVTTAQPTAAPSGGEAASTVAPTASANTASVVIEPPVATTAPASGAVATESPANTVPAATGSAVAEVLVPVEVSTNSPASSGKLQSTANYEVTPSPARGTTKASSQVTPIESSVPNEVSPVPKTASQAPVSEAAAPVATVMPAPAEVTSTIEVAAALAAPQGVAKPAASPLQVGPAVATADADDDAEATPSETPKAAFAKATAAADADDDVEPAPARPAPVLEKNTMILARNALNLQVRGSSARELLASARDPEPRTEKTVDAPATAVLPTTDPAQRLTLRHTATTPHGTAHADDVITSSLPTLGDDLVKHVTLNAEPGERTLTMRLLPKSLGEVQIEVKSTLHDVTVRIVSQDASVRETLEHHVAGLRESLAKDGRETRVEIGSQLMSNMGNGENSTWSQRQATQHDAQDRPRFVPQSLFGASAPETATVPAERRVAQHAGALNLFA